MSHSRLVSDKFVKRFTLEYERRQFEQLQRCFDGTLSPRRITQLLKLTLDEISPQVLAEFSLYCIDQVDFGTVYAGQSLDLCGTGGDKKGTFNISTAVAILLASASIVVQKNGSGSSTSHVGSSDLLRTMGIIPSGTSDEVLLSIERFGSACLHAPDFYPQLASLRRRRKLLRKPSVFNLLGPLLNPARPTHRLVGAYSKEAGEFMATAIQWQGLTKRAMVICGHGGYDEATTVGPSTVWEVGRYFAGVKIITPGQYGLKHCRPSDLECASPLQSAQIIRRIFAGEDVSARRDTVVLNAALAFQLLDDSLSPLAASAKASAIIDSGAVARYLLLLETA